MEEDIQQNQPCTHSLFDKQLIQDVQIMGINKRVMEFTKMLNRLNKLQENHINSFKEELMPDLEKQSAERNRAMEKIKKQFNIVKEITEFNDDKTILFFNSQISTLIEQNKILEKEIRYHRDCIKKSMKKIAAGKKVLTSYGLSGTYSNSPKVMNFSE